MTSSIVSGFRLWSAAAGLLLAAACALSTPPARAEVMQTNGDVIPKQPGSGCNSNASICINGNEATEGGAGDIDAVDTATISQETFSPLCELTFRVVARGADFKNTFGWYPVKRDASGGALAPALGDLHVFLGCNDLIGVEKTLAIPKDVAEIGFFLANNGTGCVATEPDPLGPTLTAQPTNLFFSQRAFNSDGDGLIHLLVWQSRANPNAFYFGWEDQSGGGDNDFEDLLTYVTGIQCAGGGEPCLADGKGACADGIMQCQDGELVCVPTQGPSDEQCNAIDDDCNGETDEGDDLCPKGKICVKGRCEPPCGTGEFRCSGDMVCVSGVCVAKSCADVECPSGSICRDGACVAPCDDVVCPYAATCRNGVCVNVCEGVDCDPGFVCEPRASSDGETVVGVCTSCDCRGCGDGQSCVDHLCIDNACQNQTCDVGRHCVAGECLDDCAGAQCPTGQLCRTGACIDDPNAGSGGAAGGADGGAGDDGGGIIIDPNPTGGGVTGGAANGQGGGAASDGKQLEVVGCGCAVPGEGRSKGLYLLVGLALAGLPWLRRRPRGVARHR
jgi:MYXO-CTERM domain-containing protein